MLQLESTEGPVLTGVTDRWSTLPLQLIVLTVPLAMLLLVGCGGGQSSSGNPPPPPPPPSFTIGPITSPLAIGPGDTTSVSFTTSSASANLSIQFSVNGLPMGVTAQVTPNPAPVNSSETLTITASANAPLVQNASLTVSGQSGSSQPENSNSILLSVEQPTFHAPNNRVDFLRTDDTPLGIAYDPVHQLIFASALHLNCVDVISAATRQVTKCIPVSGPLGVSMSTDGKRVLVGTQTQQVAWIDTSSLQVVERDTIPQIPVNAQTLNQPGFFPGITSVPGVSQAYQTSTGKLLLFSNWGFQDLSGYPQPSNMFEWDPATNTSQFVPDPNGAGVVSMSADHSKFVITGGDAYLYDAASDTLTEIPGFRGQFPLGAINPAGTQIAILGGLPASIPVQFFDLNGNLLGTPDLTACCGWAEGTTGFAVYSPDGHYLYLTLPLGQPLLVTIDATTYTVVGTAPAYFNNAAYFSEPRGLSLLQAADSTGLIYSLADHGVAINDATNYQTYPANTVAPGSIIVATPDEGPVNTATTTQIETQAFTSLPDAYFGNQEQLTGTLSNGVELQTTAPPSPTPGPVNIKVIDQDGTMGIMPQGFTYGAIVLHYGDIAYPPAGNLLAHLFGYGFGVDIPGAAIHATVGGSSAPIQSQDLFPSEVPYPFPLQHLTVTVPAGTTGVKDVTITSPTGIATISKGLHYLKSVSDFASADSFQYLLYDTHRTQVYLVAPDHIDVFSVGSNSYGTPINVPSVGGTRLLSGIALTPDGSKLLVANFGDNSVAIINPDSPTSGAVAVAFPPTAPYTLGPFKIAATSTNTAIVSGGVNPPYGPSLESLDLGTLQVTPINAVAANGFDDVASSADGSTVVVAVPGSTGGGLDVWQAATNTWSTRDVEGQFWLDATVSGDGNLFAYTEDPSNSNFPFPQMSDVQLDLIAQSNYPEFETLAANPGIQFDQTGALLYAPTAAGVDIIDARTGQLRERLYLAEGQISPNLQVAQKVMTVTPAGDTVFMATTAGLTVIELDEVPLCIGSVTPSTGSTGTVLAIRGTGFVSGTTVTMNGSSAAASFVDASTLDVTVPASLSTGAVQIVLTNPDGSTYSLDAGFEVQ
jgi:hypothetical protein